MVKESFLDLKLVESETEMKSEFKLKATETSFQLFLLWCSKSKDFRVSPIWLCMTHWSVSVEFI
jgi:hypothetical protein